MPNRNKNPGDEDMAQGTVADAILKALLEQTAKLENVSVVTSKTATDVVAINAHLVEFDKAVTKFNYGFDGLQKDFDEQKKTITATAQKTDLQEQRIAAMEAILHNPENGIVADVRVMKKDFDKKATLWGFAGTLWLFAAGGGLSVVYLLYRVFAVLMKTQGAEVPDGG